jgi:hypothetical protein
MVKLVQSLEDPWFENLQDHAIGVLNLPIRPGVCHDCLIHTDMVIITETKKLLAGELRAVVDENGVWDPRAMNNVGKEEHRLLRFDFRDWPSLNPL